MKSVQGFEKIESRYNIDYCVMLCVTWDEDLGSRIDSACNWFDNRLQDEDFNELGLLPVDARNCSPVLIVSHPHGQPKKVTLGRLADRNKEYDLVDYDAGTCACD
ncbi:hypothetical protein ElyMa_007035600 [Elysia marginata]|uniref:Uncharacterized protein n=1 Tax=Elysia marginata TaxID=1093978 RepID=A0AAV4JUY0_9GAST|nr:hypothetical protein ElyMa_007035600 [Elysia marginata]